MSGIVVTVLAGGKSERMGQDKALLPVAGSSSLLEHVVKAAASAAAGSPVLVVGRERPPGWTLPDFAAVFLPDETAGAGPLGGLQTALDHAQAPVLVLACDLPRLTPEAVGWLAAAARGAALRGELGDGLAVVNGEQVEPLFSVYAPSCLPLVNERLAQGHRSLQGLIAAGRFTRLPTPPYVAAALVNVNTPDEWARHGWPSTKP